MIYNKNGEDNGLKILAYYNKGSWQADFEDKKGFLFTETLPKTVKHQKGVELWVKRYIHKNYPGQRAFLSWVYNHNADNQGLIISVYEQGSQWIANVTTNKMNFWREIPLHYSISRLDDVITWAIDYAEGQRLEFWD